MQKTILWICLSGTLFLSGFWISRASSTSSDKLVPEMSFFSSSKPAKTETVPSSIEKSREQLSVESSDVPENETAAPEIKKRSNVITYTPSAYAFKNSRKEAKRRDSQKRRELQALQAERERQQREYYLTVILPQQQRAAQQRFDNHAKMREQMQTQEMLNLQRQSNNLQRESNYLQDRQNFLLQQQIWDRQFNRSRP